MKKRWGLNPLKDAETDHLGTAARLCRLLADGLEAQSNIELTNSLSKPDEDLTGLRAFLHGITI